MGYLIDPPRTVEGDYVAIFAQTGPADALALAFLQDHGIDARALPQLGDLVGSFANIASAGLFGGNSLVCVPADQAERALDLLEFDSGLLDE